MIKSFIKFSFVIVLVLALSLSVYAYVLPPNEFDGSVHLHNLFVTCDGVTYTQSSNRNVAAGTLNYFLLPLTSDSSITFGYDVTLTITSSYPFDLYFFSLISSTTLSGNLFPAHLHNKTTGDVFVKNQLAEKTSYSTFYYSGSIYNHVGTLLADNRIGFSKSTGSITDTLLFGKISNVAAGNTVISFESSYHNQYGNISFPFGIYIDFLGTGDPITDFENGIINFDQASSTILSNMDAVLDSSTASDFEKQFAVSIADQQLALLQSSSDTRYSAIVNNFSDTSSDIVTSFIDSGTIDILPSVMELNTLFSDCLSQAVTPDQGSLINSLYNVRLSQIQAIFDVNYANALDNVISDEEMSDKSESLNNIQDLIDIESSTLQIFEDSQYDAYLQFSEWISSIDTDKLVPYRSLFDFLFSDDRAFVLEPFLHIPFSLTLVGVILATTSAVSRARRR